MGSDEFGIIVYMLTMISVSHMLRSKVSLCSVLPKSCISTSTSKLTASPVSEAEIAKYQKLLKSHQIKMKKMSIAEEVKTLIANSHGYGTLCTNSHINEGFPSGSIVGFQIDDQGFPFFVFSKLSSHSKDILKDGRVSLVVSSNQFSDASDGRVTLTGTVEKVIEDNLVEQLRLSYLKRHHDAFWIDFGDFSYFKMNSIVSIRYVGGFARACSVAVDEYMQAVADPIAPNESSVIDRLNHIVGVSSLSKLVEEKIGIPCSQASISSVDRYGLTVVFTIPGFGEDEHQNARFEFTTKLEDSSNVLKLNSLDDVLQLLK